MTSWSATVYSCSVWLWCQLTVHMFRVEGTFVARLSTRNLFIPPIRPLDCQHLQVFLCEVTHCSSLPQDWTFLRVQPVYDAPSLDHICWRWRENNRPVWLWQPQTTREVESGGVWRLRKDLACFFSGGGQRRAKLVGPALLLAAVHTGTQFLPSCCLPDTKKGLSSSREFNETQIKDSRSRGRPPPCCSNAALWWRRKNCSDYFGELFLRNSIADNVKSQKVILNVP